MLGFAALAQGRFWPTAEMTAAGPGVRFLVSTGRRGALRTVDGRHALARVRNRSKFRRGDHEARWLSLTHSGPRHSWCQRQRSDEGRHAHTRLVHICGKTRDKPEDGSIGSFIAAGTPFKTARVGSNNQILGKFHLP